MGRWAGVWVWVLVFLALLSVFDGFKGNEDSAAYPAPGANVPDSSGWSGFTANTNLVEVNRGARCAGLPFPANGSSHTFDPDLIKVGSGRAGSLSLENRTGWPLWVVVNAAKQIPVVGVAVAPNSSASLELPAGRYWFGFEKGSVWMGASIGFAKAGCPDAHSTQTVRLSSPVDVGPGEDIRLTAEADSSRQSGFRFTLDVKSASAILIQSSGGRTLNLPRQRDGHYYVSGFINGFPVAFMVDTGASNVSVPVWVAQASGISASQLCRKGEIRTANGRASACFYKAQDIQLGNFRLKDVDLVTNDGLDVPLLGMNVLRLFNIKQDGSYLRLTSDR